MKYLIKANKIYLFIVESVSILDLSAFFWSLENSKTVRIKPIIIIKKMKIAGYNKRSELIFVIPSKNTI